MYFIRACVAKTISSLILWPLPQNPCFARKSRRLRSWRQ